MEQYLVFDIETVPVHWETLSESQQEYLLRRATNDEEIEKAKSEMALSPLTAHAVCIGLQMMQRNESGDFESLRRRALSVHPEFDDEQVEEIVLSTGDDCRLSSERNMLVYFWEILEKFPKAALISFNGRNFDAPFMMLRSALLKVKPSRNLMSGTKFNYPQHTDLLDELTFYTGAQYGATRRYNFDFYTRAFGIESPKAEGVDGSKVAGLFAEGKIETIAEYCMRDINATWELFLVWKEYLNF